MCLQTESKRTDQQPSMIMSDIGAQNSSMYSSICGEQLCNCCQNIDFHRATLSSGTSKVQHYEVQYQENFRMLRESARTCPGCRFIIEEVFPVQSGDDYTIDDTSYPVRARLFAPDERDHRQPLAKRLVSLEFWCAWPSKYDPEAALFGQCDIYADEESAAAKAGDIAGRPIYSAEDGRTSHSWLSYCTKYHRNCGAYNRDGLRNWELPTRVLDVEGSSWADLRLFITHGACGRYLTLSHRWGGRKIIKTTLSNLEAHTRRIHFSDLNKTFQDAVVITRKLGFRYLWIDSLCIIQDSKDDWRMEAGRMASIYSGSELTLSATWATSGDSGLFYPRSECRKVEFPYINVNGHAEGRWIMRKRSAALFSSDVLEGPLNGRGWVLQERLLSNRALHFCKDQLYWECKESVWKECTGIINDGLSTYPIASFHNNIFRTRIGTTQTSGIIAADAETKRLCEGWYKLIEDYTNRSLSVIQDRLPAVLGIANTLRCYSSGRYIWGLWESGMLRGLLWSIDTKDIAYKRLVSPSWSWAAWSAPIHFRLLRSPKLLGKAVVINIEEQIITKRLGHNAPKTCIRIKGPLVRISAIKPSKGSGTNCLLFNSQRMYMGAACLDSPLSFPIFWRNMWVLTLYIDDPLIPTPLEASEAEVPHAYGLILEKRRMETYRRIGYAETSINEFYEAPTKLVVIT